MSRRSLFSLGRGGGVFIWLSAAMHFINGALYIAAVVLIARFTGDSGHSCRLPVLLLQLTAFAAGKAVMSVLEGRFSCRATIGVKSSVRELIFSKVRRLGPAYADESGTSELITNSIDGVESLEIFFGRFIPQAVYSLAIPLVLFSVTLGIYPAFSLILLAAVPVIPLSMMLISKWAARSMSGFWGDYQDLSSVFLENLQGITTLKLFNKSGKRMSEMEAKAWDFRNSTMELLKMQLTSITVMDTLVYGFAAVGIIMAVLGFSSGRLELFELIILLLLSVEFFLPIRKLGSLFHAGVNGIQAGRAICRFLDADEPLTAVAEGFEPVGTDIEIRNLGFTYGTGHQEILKDASLVIRAGERLGIAGPSGCGKSTLGRLLLRFYDPTEGEILFGGVPMPEVSLSELRRRITLVEAGSRIFDGTIKDNLRLAVPEAGYQSMISACAAVGLAGIGCPADLEKPTGENGAMLSGGERQRLAIARAILYDPDVFIFDEAAGSVDAESEQIIKATIRSLPAEKTIIIISHRSSMLEDAQRVVTVSNGRIVEVSAGVGV